VGDLSHPPFWRKGPHVARIRRIREKTESVPCDATEWESGGGKRFHRVSTLISKQRKRKRNEITREGSAALLIH